MIIWCRTENSALMRCYRMRNSIAIRFNQIPRLAGSPRQSSYLCSLAEWRKQIKCCHDFDRLTSPPFMHLRHFGLYARRAFACMDTCVCMPRNKAGHLGVDLRWIFRRATLPLNPSKPHVLANLTTCNLDRNAWVYWHVTICRRSVGQRMLALLTNAVGQVWCHVKQRGKHHMRVYFERLLPTARACTPYHSRPNKHMLSGHRLCKAS